MKSIKRKPVYLFTLLILSHITLIGQLSKTVTSSPDITAKEPYPVFSKDSTKEHLQHGASLKASFGKGIELSPVDKSFSMKLNFRIQALATYSKTLDPGNNGTTALMIRRSRVKAAGFILAPKFTYKVELGLTNRDIESTQRGENVDNPGPILDMMLKWNFAGNWVLGFGQGKLPGNRERLVSSANLQFVDRSTVNSSFTTDRDAGFWLNHATKGDFVLRNTFTLSSGEGKNRNIGKNPNTKDGGLSYSYRMEVLPLGLFSKKGEITQSDLAREPSPKLAIAGAYNFNNNTLRTQGQLGSYFFSGETKDIHTGFIDYMFKYRGFSMTGEYALKHVENPISRETGGLEDGSVYVFKGQGFSSQAGFLFKNNLEIAGRYAILRPHKDIMSFRENQRDLTLAISKYIQGHKLKVQTDFTHTKYGERNSVGVRFQVETQF